MGPDTAVFTERVLIQVSAACSRDIGSGDLSGPASCQPFSLGPHYPRAEKLLLAVLNLLY